MDVWCSTDEVYQGSLQYREKKTLSTRCRWFAAKVFLESSEGQKRLELRDTDSQLLVISLPLNEVLSVSAAETKELKHAFQIVTARKNYLFGTKSRDHRTQWIRYTLDVANAVPLPNVVYSFEVQMLPNGHSNLLNLHGIYTFKITDTHVALFSNSGLPTQFLLDLVDIRRTRFTFFKQNSKDFCICAIYTHRCSPIGEGTYVFQTPGGNDVSKIMTCRLTMRYQATGTPLPDNLLDEKLHRSSAQTLPFPLKCRSSAERVMAATLKPKTSVESLLLSSLPPVPMATLDEPNADGASNGASSGSSQDAGESLDCCPKERVAPPHSPHEHEDDLCPQHVDSSIAMDTEDSSHTSAMSQDRNTGYDVTGYDVTRKTSNSSIYSKHKPSDKQQEDTGSEEDTDDHGYIKVLPSQRKTPSDPTHHIPGSAHSTPDSAYHSQHRIITDGDRQDSIAAESVVMGTDHMTRTTMTPGTFDPRRKASSNSISYEPKPSDNQHYTEDTGREEDTDDHGYIKVLPSQRDPHSDPTHRVPDPAHNSPKNDHTLQRFHPIPQHRTINPDQHYSRERQATIDYSIAAESVVMGTGHMSRSMVTGCDVRRKTSKNSISSNYKPSVNQHYTEDTGSQQDTDDHGYIKVLPSQQDPQFNPAHHIPGSTHSTPGSTHITSDSAHSTPDSAHHSQRNEHTSSLDIEPGSLHGFDSQHRIITDGDRQDSIAAESVVMGTDHMTRTTMTPGTFDPRRKASNNSISYEPKPSVNQHYTEDTGSEEDTDDHGYIKVLPSQRDPHSDPTHQVPDPAHQHTQTSYDRAINGSHTSMDHVDPVKVSTSADTYLFNLYSSSSSSSSDDDDDDDGDVSVEHSDGVNHYESIGRANQYSDLLASPTDPMTPVEVIYATVEDALQVPSLEASPLHAPLHEATPPHDVGEVNYTASPVGGASHVGGASPLGGVLGMGLDIDEDLPPVHNERTTSISLRPPAPLPGSLPPPPAPPPRSLTPPPALPPRSLPPPPARRPRSLPPSPALPPRSLAPPPALPPRSLPPPPVLPSLLPSISIKHVCGPQERAHATMTTSLQLLDDLTVMQKDGYCYANRETLGDMVLKGMAHSLSSQNIYVDFKQQQEHIKKSLSLNSLRSAQPPV